MDGSLYILDGVSRCYGTTCALERFTLSIPKGGVTGIAGPNGSGKSTLLKLLAFIERPDTGRLLFEGREELPFSPAVRHRVTLMPQNPFLMNRRVFENVSYGLKVKKDRNEVAQRVSLALSRVGLDVGKFAGRRRHELSGGEAQRVALAARLILEPSVLILDEPTAGVDAASTFLIRQAILAFAANPEKTVILTSHDAAWLADVSDGMLFFFRGRPVEEKMGLMLFGPFERGPRPGVWLKRGDEGGTLAVPEPPGPDAVAAVPERLLRLGGTVDSQHAACTAEVREVARRKGQPGTHVTLIAEGFPLTLTCPVADVPEPGQVVRVTYPLSSVIWL